MKHYGRSEFANRKIARPEIEVGSGSNKRRLHQLSLVFIIGGINQGGLIKVESMTRIITHVDVDGTPGVFICDVPLVRCHS